MKQNVRMLSLSFFMPSRWPLNGTIDKKFQQLTYLELRYNVLREIFRQNLHKKMYP